MDIGCYRDFGIAASARSVDSAPAQMPALKRSAQKQRWRRKKLRAKKIVMSSRGQLSEKTIAESPDNRPLTTKKIWQKQARKKKHFAKKERKIFLMALFISQRLITR